MVYHNNPYFLIRRVKCIESSITCNTKTENKIKKVKSMRTDDGRHSVLSFIIYTSEKKEA